MGISLTDILAERLQCQRLTVPLKSDKGYNALFRLLQPLSPVANTRPGDPPCFTPRTKFDDGAKADQLRAQRIIVKGRFLGGSIGYVLEKDLAIYANAFQRPLSSINIIQKTVLDAVQTSGPLTPRQIKAETGLLNKQIMPALHRFQKAFLVYEDQIDNDWERGWYDFNSEWPEIEIREDQQQAAVIQVLICFLQGHVFATFEQLKDWSRLPSRFLIKLIHKMEDAALIVPHQVQGLGQGWTRTQDRSLRKRKVKPSVFMLHKADVLVKSHASELKQRFGDYEVLQYLLIDGSFQGAVLGHWRIGSHDVSDIIVTLPSAELSRRKTEILNVVAKEYHPPNHHILRYDNKVV